jgi:hypothetical protein
MIDEWGWEWYGRYWAILGKIGMLVTESRQTFALQTNNGSPFPLKLLANDLGTTVERLENFLAYLSDNHLIDKKAWDEKRLIFCPKLKDRADEYTKKLLTKSRHSPEQEVDIDTDKNKRIEEPKNKAFDVLWKSYPNRSGKKNALRHFNTTVKTAEDYKNIQTALQNYLASGNVKNGFIKNGSTWFNEWQDWVEPTPQMMKGTAKKGYSYDASKYSPLNAPDVGDIHRPNQISRSGQERKLLK